jgi:mRNA interferase HicA
VKGSELLRRLERLSRARGARLSYQARRGKGSHGTLFWNRRFAVIPDLRKELSAGTLHAILKQLGLAELDLE